MRIDRRLLYSFDWTLFGLLTVILCIGLLNLNSAGASASGDPPFLKQIRWIAVGFVLMFAVMCVDYRLIARSAYTIHGVAILLLILVYFYGNVTHGSQRWINLGGFSFQPSELVKLTLVLALARYFNDHKLPEAYTIRSLFVPILMVLVPFVMIIRQPDLGTALLLLILFGSMVLFVGVKWRSVLLTALTGLLLVPVLWNFMHDYQRERVLTFFDPGRDPLGSGYHIIQSIIAVGSGMFFGKGYMHGTQSQLKFLPEQQTDFVFSVFAEEWGFLGAVILLMVCLAFILWGLKIAQQARDFLGTLIAFGLVMLVFWGFFINIGMVIGILPVVGIPLPFLSYGGSSMVVLLTGVGLLMSVSMRRYLLQHD